MNSLYDYVRNLPNTRLRYFLTKIYRSIQIFRNTPSKLSLIRKHWKEKKLFTAEFKNEKLFKNQNLINYKKSGQCFFIPKLFQNAGLKKLFFIMQEKQYRRIAILGNHPHQKKIIQALQRHFPQSTINTFNDLLTGKDSFDSQFYEIAILIACKKNAISLIRKLLCMLRFPGDIIIGSKEQYFTMSTKEIESTQPIVVCAYPCAGTHRFIFSFEYLMKKLHWEFFGFSPFLRNVRYIHTLQKKTQTDPDDNLIDNAFYWKIQTLDYLQCMKTHEYFTLEKIKNLDCRMVVLMRDPRDIINSFYWHTIHEVHDKKNHIHRIINGYARFALGNYAFNWPNVNKIMDNYLLALEKENFCVIRFEDLHQNSANALQKLMTQLKLYPHPLFEISKQDFLHAAFLGSFEFQTKGKRKRGENNQGRLGGEHSGVSCRKGIIGDWKSSFTQAAVEHFKELTQDKLIRLGYEKTMDWKL